jgi:sugar phosphate permease
VAHIYQGIVITDLETGNFTVPPGLSAGLKKLEAELTNVAYAAFHTGLEAALFLSAALAVLAAVLALVTLPTRPTDAGS